MKQKGRRQCRTEKIPTPPANCTKKQNTCKKGNSFFVLVFAKMGQRLEKRKICSESTLPITSSLPKSVTIRRFYTDHSQSTFMFLTIQLLLLAPSLPPHMLLSSSFGRSIVEVTPLGKGCGVSRKVKNGNTP